MVGICPGLRLGYYVRPKLFVIEELGILPFERSGLLFTTNQVVTQWGTVFGDDVLAAAILDRVLHHSHTITFSGDSYRLKQKRRADFFGRAAQRIIHEHDPRRAGGHACCRKEV